MQMLILLKIIIMKAKNLFFPTLREDPSEAEVISHKLMIKSGLIRKVASGVYNWLPLGVKILRKVENIVREEMNSFGGQEVLMPMVQPGELWKETERWQKYGKELLVFQDRHEREFCLGPTHEEVITDLLRREVKSHKQLPVTLYQIQTKFRDEIRPRFGVMRSREFLMKDAYSFDLTKENLDLSYKNMKEAYVKIFDRLGLDYRVVKADTGEIGGSDSEEIHVLADTGEDLLVFSNESDFASNVELMLEEGEDPQSLKGKPSPDGKGTLELKKGIEVGHIFKLGTKYSESMNFKIQVENENKFLEMGCYGIGISRIVAAAIEQNHDEKGIIWPKAISPFEILIIVLNDKNDSSVMDQALKIYQELKSDGTEVLIDDRDERAGVKFADADLLGIPKQVIVGKRGIEKNIIEVTSRITGEKRDIKISEAASQLKD